MSLSHDSSTPDDSAWLLNLIQTLDRATPDRTSPDGGSLLTLNRRISATLCVAFEDPWIRTYRGTGPIAQRTAAAALSYLANPDPTTWATFFRAATGSYAFGPGDGCHTPAELGPGCGAGTGCRTGIGWIWGLVPVVGATAVRERILSAFGAELAVTG